MAARIMRRAHAVLFAILILVALLGEIARYIVSPTTYDADYADIEKRRTERQKRERRDAWRALQIGLTIVFIALYLMEVSMTTIAIICMIILLVAIFLDWIEKRNQRAEADDRAEQIQDLAKK